MKIEEVCRTFAVSLERLQSFENAGLFKTHEAIGNREYDTADIERLSLLLTLYDIGLDVSQMKQFVDGASVTKNKNTKIQLLKKQRQSTLETIHTLQKKIDAIDCLVYQMSNSKKNL